ncbi:MAG: hypothetical protein PHP64_07155 [Actinomycetota bacterium]|nr:hypothetical protein [Actinomycetota bacterium]
METTSWLEEELTSAFRRAYPDIEEREIIHMSRNFTQVVQGIIEIGERVGAGGSEVTQMDIANGLVYWCVANTSLEDIFTKRGPVEIEGSLTAIDQETLKKILSECVARVADWLIGLEVLRKKPELYEKFIRGAVTLGASDWERNRGKLKY